MLQKILFKINAVILNFLFIKEILKKKCTQQFSTLIIIINIFEHQIHILEYFMKDHVTLE